jgi:hypothetical protein
MHISRTHIIGIVIENTRFLGSQAPSVPETRPRKAERTAGVSNNVSNPSSNAVTCRDSPARELRISRSLRYGGIFRVVFAIA